MMEGINTKELYEDMLTMTPKYETFGENLYWTWANWQTMWMFGNMNEPPFERKYFMIRQRNFSKYKKGEQHMTDLYSFNKEKLRAGDYCFYCYREVPKEELTADHVFPRAKGGTNDLNNIIFVCKHCNSSKGKKELLKWYLVDKEELPSPFVLGHYYKQIYQYATEHNLMDKSFANVEQMELPFDPRSILLLHTRIATRWYFDNWIKTNNKDNDYE